MPINNEKEKNLLAAIPNEPLLSQRAVLWKPIWKCRSEIILTCWVSTSQSHTKPSFGSHTCERWKARRTFELMSMRQDWGWDLGLSQNSLTSSASPFWMTDLCPTPTRGSTLQATDICPSPERLMDTHQGPFTHDPFWARAQGDLASTKSSRLFKREKNPTAFLLYFFSSSFYSKITKNSRLKAKIKKKTFKTYSHSRAKKIAKTEIGCLIYFKVQLDWVSFNLHFNSVIKFI